MTNKNGPLSLLLIAYFTYMIVGMPAGLLNVAWTYMQATFHVTLGSLGVSTVGYLLGSLISGRVIGRVGIVRTDRDFPYFRVISCLYMGCIMG